MDTQLLSTMLKELILDNDRVGLPGIGTFVAEHVGASFSDKGYTINPPYRRLTLSPEVSEDGLLVGMYRDINGVDAESAESILNRYLADIRRTLVESRMLILPGLGRIRVTRANDFFFIPDEDLDICPAAFGLSSVSLKSHSRSDTVLSETAVIAETVKSAEHVPAQAEPDGPEETLPVPESDPQGIVPDDKAEPADEDAGEAESRPVHVRKELPDEPAVKSRTGSAFRTIAVVMSVLLILLAAFVILGKVAPDFVDSFLYTAEERAILDYPL